MWILIITLLHYSHPAIGKFSPVVTSVEFSSKDTCENARVGYESAFKKVSDELNKAIADELAVGQLRGPHAVIITALCFQK